MRELPHTGPMKDESTLRIERTGIYAPQLNFGKIVFVDLNLLTSEGLVPHKFAVAEICNFYSVVPLGEISINNAGTN